MSSLPWEISLSFVLLLTPSFLLYRWLKARNTLPYPPGPRGLLFLGNVLDVPATKQWEAYEEMGRKLNSPVIHLNMFGTHIVSINNLQIARDIFEKRGSPHISRPPFAMLRDVVGHDWNYAFFPYGPVWKTCRKQVDTLFRPTDIRSFRPLEMKAIHQLLSRLLDSPKSFGFQCHYFSCSIMLEIAFGISVESDNDPFIKIVNQGLHAANESGNYPVVDALPWVQHLPSWLPGMSWKTEFAAWRQSNQDMRDVPFEAAKKALSNHTAKTSVVSQLLEMQVDNKALSDGEIRGMCATLVAAGVETTGSLLLSTILLACKFPEIQKSAQAELDGILGTGRLPNFDDRPRLPFIEAFCRELVRYVCVTPFCLPHSSLDNDIWHHEGLSYLIPKDAIMLPNVWAMSRDTALYVEPERFNPSRFLKADGTLDPDILDPSFIFGFRPRHCPGRIMAEDILFIYVASMLAAFTFQPVADATPSSTDFDALFRTGINIYPRDFECDIIPRNEHWRSLVMNIEDDP